MKLWAWDEKNLSSITHAIRTAIAATASVIIARLVQMPEVYWAAIATLVVMQSTLGRLQGMPLQSVGVLACVSSFRIPRKRCYPLSPAKHRKILRLLRGGLTQGCLRFRKENHQMKTKQSQSNSKRAPWRIFRRSSRRHDPMLVLNMTLFNFTDGWNRAFSREQYARFSV